jgi:hypothetical protein
MYRFEIHDLACMNIFADIIKNRTSSYIHRISTIHRLLLAVIALAAVLRIGWVLYAQTIPGSDFHQYDLLAQRLANGEGYVDEFGEPSAFYAIGWPFFLSIVYRIFGYSLIIAQLVNALMAVASVALVFVISRHLLRAQIALIAALLVAINPTLVLYSSTHGTESLFILQLLIISWLLIRSSKSPTVLSLVLIGILTGLAVLVRPVAICVPLGAFAAYYFMDRHDTRNSLKKALIIVGVSIVIVAPWVARNTVVVGATTLQTSSGLTLWIGHNPDATGGLMPPPLVEGLGAQKATPGAGDNTSEAEANSAYTSAAIESILDNPIRTLSLVPNRIFELWGGHRHAVNHSTRQSDREIPDSIIKFLPLLTQGHLVLLLGMVIVAYGLKNTRKLWLTGVGVSLTSTLFFWNAYHALSIGSGRYHVPMEPFLAIMAATAISALLWSRNKTDSDIRNSTPQFSGSKVT